MPNPNSAITVIAWKKLSTRSQLLARALNANLWFFKDNIPYARAFFKTLLGAVRKKPRILVVQLPQGPLLLEAWVLKKLIGCKVVADIHTGFVVSSDWKGKLLNQPFVKLLPTADLVVAHNETQLELVPKNVAAKTLVVYDPWQFIEKQTSAKAGAGGYVVFPASFAPDEPLEEVISAVTALGNVKLYVTGNWKRKPSIQRLASSNVVFTGFLSDEEFNRLLANASAIVAGTKREYTALMSAWEAIAYRKPLAVTETRTLKRILDDYAFFYNYKQPQTTAQAIQKALAANPNLEAYKKLETKTQTDLQTLKRRLASLYAV